MSSPKIYYTLQYARNDLLHRSGDLLFNSENVLRIGQTEYCEARLANEGAFEDTVLAVVRPMAAGNSWVLIPTSPFREHEIRVNGAAVECLHILRDGDRISFAASRQELLFAVHHDDEYTARGITTVRVGVSRRTLLGAFLVILLLMAGGGFWLHRSIEAGRFSEEMINEAQASVFSLRIDSFQLVAIQDEDTTVLRSCVPPRSLSGTAFITADSLLVTARHCLQPWLNDEDTLGLDTAHIIPLHTRWALQAETHNQLYGDDTQWEVVSYLTLLTTTEQDLTLRSSDFTINTLRDNVVELGDFEHEYYWRSITVRPQLKEMALGDMAFMHAPAALLALVRNRIPLATPQLCRQLLNDKKRPLLILGYPNLSHLEGKHVQNSEGTLKDNVPCDTLGLPAALISMGCDITEGYSGGPVLMRHGSGYVCVGLVSVTDNFSSSVKYAVPITEILRYKQYIPWL